MNEPGITSKTNSKQPILVIPKTARQKTTAPRGDTAQARRPEWAFGSKNFKLKIDFFHQK
jgi:hypothetical protein